MTGLDFILTPIYLLFIYVLAYIVRSRIDSHLDYKKFFLWALTLRIVGAIATGLIYQYYYNGGDTFTFYQGTKVIWQAFTESPQAAFTIIFEEAGVYIPETVKYTQNIWTFRDPGTFMIVRLASFIGFFCFNTYLTISVIFATFSFFGVWKLYTLFVRLYPHLYRELAIAILFMPSVVFWGSGLFKDTVTFASLAWLTYSVYKVFIERKDILTNVITGSACAFLIINIKIYILLSFLPPLLFWILLHYKEQINSPFLRRTIAPLIIISSITISFFLIQQLGEEFEKYAASNVFDSAASMQRWHSYLARNDQGSGYNLGIQSGSPQEILSTIPAAINVTLFRPYLWEVRNPFMLLTALESLFILFLTIKAFFKTGFFSFFRTVFRDPFILFNMSFALIFAFAVGFSTYNFGALARYKIPCLPFFVAGLYLIIDSAKNKQKPSNA